MKRTVTVASLAMCLAMAPLAPSSKAYGADDMAAMISAAKTPADHQAIAADYDKQAAAAEAEATRHDAMGKAYTGALKEKAHLDDHCRTVANGYRTTAKELKAMADAHRAAAK